MTVTVDASTDLDRTRFFIDNEWVEPRGTETHRAVEAATEDLLGTAALGTDADIDAAVKAARAAIDEGPRSRVHDRPQALARDGTRLLRLRRCRRRGRSAAGRAEHRARGP